MTQQRDAILTFGIFVMTGAAECSALSLQILMGFRAGVIVTLCGAVIARTDFD